MGEERLILPPPLQRRRENEILNELPNVLGLVLWQDVRHLHAWVEASASVRPHRRTPPEIAGALPDIHPGSVFTSAPSPKDLFNPSPPPWVVAKRKDARAQCGELAAALDALQAVAASPLSVDRAAVADGCRQVVEWALAHEHTQTAIEFAEAAALVAPEDPAMANLAGRVTRNAREYSRAEVWFNRGIGYAREQNDKVELTRGHLGYGTLYRLLDRVAEARRYLNSGSRIARRLGQPSLAAEAQHDLCVLLIVRGHYAEAEKHAHTALRWYPKNHPRFPLFVADVAYLFVLRRNFAAAVRVLRGVIRTAELSPSTRSAILALYSRALAGAGHIDEAARQSRRVLRLLQRHQEWETLALWHLAEAERASANWESAEAYASRALEIATDQGDRETMTVTRRTLGAILAKMPAPPRAIRKDDEFRVFVEMLVNRLANWAPRRARPRRAPWGDQWAA
jgi:tetratricopeptide (TPR) repeat protein